MTCKKGLFGGAIAAVRDLHSLISPCRGDGVAIWRPCQCIDLIFTMPTIVKDLITNVKVISMLYRCPIAQRAIPGARSHATVVRLPANAEDTGSVAQEVEGQGSAGCVPDLHSFVFTARGQQLTSFRPGYRVHAILMSFVSNDSLTIGRIPYLHGSILTPRGNEFPIWRPCYSSHFFGMSGVDEFALSIASIKDLDKFIVAGRGYQVAIRGPGDRIDRGQMAHKNQSALIIDAGWCGRWNFIRCYSGRSWYCQA